MKSSYKILLLLLSAVVVACASMGTPDGGPFDEEPPVLLEAVPAIGATNVEKGKVVLAFDENIKLVNAFEKVVVSPPQIQMPEIKYSGKRVTVELIDSLIPNTTYSIDFNDAIADNNEGNPYENFAYYFSTGDVVDTFAVSGAVLSADNLEPIKGMVVGIHSCLDDTAFTHKVFERVSRTDSRGRFVIKGLAPGNYRVYALADANQNFMFDQKSEQIAFMETYVSPFASEAIRPDTIWRDSITIDTVRYVRYTRFQPDDLVLRAFKEELFVQYLVKNPRDEHHKVNLFFASPNDELPVIEGLDYDINDKFILEKSVKNDTLTLWFKDSAFYRADTLALKVTYKVTDSIGALVDRTDTIYPSPRRTWDKVVKKEQEHYENEYKDFLKKAKKSPDYDENNPPQYIPKTKVLKPRFTGSASMDVNGHVRFIFEEPLLALDTSAVTVSIKVDTLWVPVESVFRQNEDNIRTYDLFAEWRPGEKYLVKADSATFKGLYGGVSEAFSQEIKFRTLEEYAVLYLTIPGTDNNAVVQLLNGSEKIVQEERTENNTCSFYFIRPGVYYLRLFMDDNNNGKWDTGNFEKGIQPEKVYYYNRSLELRAMFEYSQDDWDIDLSLDAQKPLEITKQKPDKEKKKMNRNATRKFK